MKNINNYLSNFPESIFNTNNKQYYEKLITGFQKMENSTVFITGLARNCEEQLIYNIKRIQKLASMFKDYRIFIYENDSNDRTANILKQWSINNRKVTVSSENVGKIRHKSDQSIERRIDMSWYRNQYLIKIQQQSSDYTVVYDFDVDGGFSYEGVANSIGWGGDVYGSNSILVQDNSQYYYDTYALELFKECSDVEKNLLEFRRGDKPKEVLSCFGGLAIYKTKCFPLHSIQKMIVITKLSISK